MPEPQTRQHAPSPPRFAAGGPTCARPAVYWNALDPFSHLAFASALLGEGSHSAARLHAEQARTLAGPDAAGIQAMAQPMIAMAEERERAEGRRDFQ